MNEFDLIKNYFADRALRLAAQDNTVIKGIGDDCAVLRVPDGHELVVSIDTLNEGIHFLKDAPADLLAERAMRVCISDLAAMGAEPLWFTLAITLPDNQPEWLALFSDGLFRAAEQFSCTLIGGNTTKGPLSISIQVHGSVPQGQALLRSNAAVGDKIYVSGSLGNGAAGLAFLQKQLNVSPEFHACYRDKFFLPEPQIALGKTLRNIASSVIDISDGLLSDIGHICHASNVGALLYVENIPLSHEGLKLEPSQENIWRHWALSGGDDYQLCFTSSDDCAVQALQKIFPSIACVGVITSTKTIQCSLHNQPFMPEKSGFMHF